MIPKRIISKGKIWKLSFLFFLRDQNNIFLDPNNLGKNGNGLDPKCLKEKERLTAVCFFSLIEKKWISTAAVNPGSEN